MEREHIFKRSFHQNPNIGLSLFTNNNLTIGSFTLPISADKKIKEVLQVEKVVRTDICGTNLPGIFIAGNDKKLLLPNIIYPKEREILSRSVGTYLLDTEHTALGNNIIADNDRALISNSLRSKRDEIKEALELKEAEVFSIGEIDIIGSLARKNDKGIILSPIAREEDADFIEEFFKLPVTFSTVNFGSPYISSGFICNSKGFVIGGRSTGVEITDIDEGLGFL